MLCFTLSVLIASPTALAKSSPNTIQSFMFYKSFIQDDPACKVTIKDGIPHFDSKVAGSTAASCPDAFAWVQFAQAIDNEWWNWGLDQTIWPEKPWPLCTKKGQKRCCDPNKKITKNSKQPKHCPAFRGDYSNPSVWPATPKPSPSGNVINHTGVVSIGEVDPGRLLRDLELELVFRNKSMIDYIYRNDLYSKEALGARNKAQNTALKTGDFELAHKLEVRFPVDAVMVKADFMHEDIMRGQNLIQDYDNQGNKMPVANNPDFPYLTIKLENSGKGSTPGIYYMVSMTNASKELPIWHWYALEHVANLGRCDYIGCNDSFGFKSKSNIQKGANFGKTFIPPKFLLNNDLAETNSNNPLFDTGKKYLPNETGEKITKQLASMLTAMGIGTAEQDPDPYRISKDDPAWLNYRLKGTQSSFTTRAGLPTGTGSTVTEGGFVNSSSCATCHAQASVDSEGNSGMQGVGASWRLNLLGYNQVEMGTPKPSMFYNNDQPSISATQIDFVWGILLANCQKVSKQNKSLCHKVPNSPTLVPNL